ncbi:hypothetical protein TNCV_1345711 [Trichonephila clavipes]|nr:hypothetical protein TNCV_1345711 [Trichonephila clavipes]
MVGAKCCMGIMVCLWTYDRCHATQHRVHLVMSFSMDDQMKRSWMRRFVFLTFGLTISKVLEITVVERSRTLYIILEKASTTELSGPERCLLSVLNCDMKSRCLSSRGEYESEILLNAKVNVR